MHKLYSFFKSVRLAVVLIAIIVLGSIIATLIPQGEDLAFYYHNFSRVIAWLIVNLRFDAFFQSPLFLAAAILFFLNLSVCMVDRLVRELKGRRRRRYGPDLIHIGLLILIVGGLVTALGRREGFVYVGEGDQIRLPGEYVATLESFEFLTYEDGRPKDWISTVSVNRNGETVTESFPIEVNNPLKVGSVKVFQSSYSEQHLVYLRDESGKELILQTGEPLHTEGATYLFAQIERSALGTLQAVFEEWRDSKVADIKKLAAGAKLPGYDVSRVEIRNLTGLQAVSDPGYLPVLIGLLLCTFGLILTYAQKIGDKEI